MQEVLRPVGAILPHGTLIISFLVLLLVIHSIFTSPLLLASPISSPSLHSISITYGSFTVLRSTTACVVSLKTHQYPQSKEKGEEWGTRRVKKDIEVNIHGLIEFGIRSGHTQCFGSMSTRGSLFHILVVFQLIHVSQSHLAQQENCCRRLSNV